ncbi:helix-turn-helix domain-containing protein [Pedobacter psychroterrae]|uniref:DNA-binding protein n=1 Tax=Pedobacter psychroterrae TaxID=2530453 RepID=A0A4R0NH18_9SPHI|nr:helix-turn-helix domain-containing protein [Pedobacter psychroterrae]TCC99860.1 DNA-binding protein [Pedobacter psychroterrae]
MREFLQLWKAHQEEMRMAALRDPLLNSETTKFMLQVGERTLYNYVAQGKLTCEKRGQANFYLESSVLALMRKSR